MKIQKSNSRTNAAFTPSRKGRLLQCAAASAAAWALLPTAAHAAIPPECDEQMNPNLVTCVVPAPDTLDPIEVNQDNTTIVIGSADTPTELVAGADDGIVLNGDGAQTVLVNSGSSVAAAQGNGIVLAGEGLLSTVVGTDASVLAAGGNGIQINMNGLDGGINAQLSGSVLASENGVRLRNFGDSGETSLVVQNGASITGQNGNGIDVITIAGDLSIDTSDASVSGEQRGMSASVSSAGEVEILTGDVNGAQDDGIFVEVQSAVGSVLVDSSAGTVTGGANGIQLDNNSSQVSVQITTAGVNGSSANGVIVETEGTDLLVDTSAGLVTANDTGLLVDQQGTGETAIQTATVRANNGAGIEANTSATATDLLVTTDGGLVSGGTFGIDLDHDGSGMVALTTADVFGETADGISVNNAGQALAINSIQGSVEGLATGINVVQNGSDTVSIQTADVTGTNGFGIFALNNTGAAMTITTADGTVSGGLSGISAQHEGSGALTITTADIVAGERGISAETGAASNGLSIDTSAGSIESGVDGIFAEHGGTGAISVITGNVTSETGVGIAALNSADGDGVTVDTSAGLVTANDTGLLIDQQGTGETAIQTATVRANNGAGIEANTSATATDLLVTTDGGLVSGGTFGIDLDHDGSGMIALTTAGVVGENGDGINVNNAGAAMAINSIQGSVEGLSTGINAVQNGSDTVSIQTADVTGTNGFGIFALNNTGAAMTITSTDGTVSGALSGIFAQHDGSGALTITTADVVAGEDGISAETSALSNGLSIDTSAGSIESGIDGIFAEHGGTGAISVVTGNVTSETGVGVAALNSADGDGVTVDTSAGSVSAASIGLAAANLGTGDLSVTTGDVTSAQDIAIQVVNLASGDGVFLDTTAGSVSGASNGISANNQGSLGMTIATGDVSGADGALLAFNEGIGDLTITTANLTSSQGAGVTAFNGNGSFDVSIDTSAGAVNAATNGVQVVQQSSGSVTIVSGDVSSGEDGIAFLTGGGDTFITNQGQIESGGFEIFADPASLGAIEVTNNGTIVGNISLGDDEDVVTNEGTFRAVGDSAFGAGDDLFTNNGVLEASGTAAFTDLEQLTNNGSIVLADGNFGDTLQLSGDYAGMGGQLALDVDLGGAGGTDVLVIGGAATGTTVIDPSIEGQTLAFGNTTLLVDAGAGTAADAFALAGGDIVTEGFLAFNLSFDAANNDFLLGSAVGPAAFRTLKIGEGALSAWYRSADAWDAHIDSRRHNSDVDQGPLWLQLYGAKNERDDQFDYTSSGFTQDIVLDYDQAFFGFQMGAEFGPGRAGDGAYYGVTAGYQSSDIDFDVASDSIDYDVFNLGAYAGYQKDAFFAHALVKYDFINAEMDGQSIGYNAEIDGGSIGVRAEAGYRWETGKLFVEPSVSLEYQSTSLDDFSALGANFALENLDGLRGIAGVRLGGDSKVGNDTVLTYYGSASVVHEFAGEGELVFSTPLSSATLVNNPIGTFGRFDLGLDITGKNGVSGFVEGNADLSGDFTSFGGRIGLKIAF